LNSSHKDNPLPNLNPNLDPNLSHLLTEDDPRPERWQTIVLIASPEMRAFYELVDEDHLDEFCNTREQQAALKKFMVAFRNLLHLAVRVDRYVLQALMAKIEEENKPQYWMMVIEYCKLRLLGHEDVAARKGVRGWEVRTDFVECKRTCGKFLRDAGLKKKVEVVQKAHGVCIVCIERLRELMKD
jgi:hypothetical protein